jgi:hypothetical protein
MDFFPALDQGKYCRFKMHKLNAWVTGAFDPPDTVNKIYRVAGSWVKLVPWLEEQQRQKLAANDKKG